MTDNKKKDLWFTIYMAGVLVCAYLYFAVPERGSFIEFNLEWWREMLSLLMK